MEFFHEPKIDWMGKKWYFIGLSIPLLVAGLVSIAWHRGLVYGIDFRGGTLVYVKFATPPNLDQIRARLDQENLHGATLQRAGAASDNEVIVGLDLKTTTEASAIDAGKKAIFGVMDALYGKGPEGKVEFNNASAQTVAEHLITSDPLHLAAQGSESATKSYQKLAEAMVAYRTGPERRGLLSDFQQLAAVPGANAAVLGALRNDFYLSSYAVLDTEIVGPKVGADLRQQALLVTLLGLGAMLVYIWFRFELIYGVAAVVATFHDVLITLGLFSILNSLGYPGTEITLTVIAALLTLVGYSMNDTIVVFDRIRENVRLNKRQNFSELVNRSINQTLSRTILTSGLTFLAVLSLFLFGGEVIHGFSLVLVIGVIIGTYSSIAIASPVLVYWTERKGGTPFREKARPGVLERETAGARR
ncbi:MAG: protein translocase subunit SecF [Acidobacteria bacterium]|nr:MAG: protein translocase subunit SecF [Acidobacteriota bacterium]